MDQHHEFTLPADAPRPTVWNTDLEYEERINGIAHERGLTHVRADQFPILEWATMPLDSIDAAITASEQRPGGTTQVLLELASGAIASLSSNGSLGRLTVAAGSMDAASSAFDDIADVVRDRRLPVRDTRVPIHFWTSSPQGPRPMRIKVEAPEWADIVSNYPADVGAELARVMEASRSQVNGVALWRGDPGTGKTTALRALAHAWSSWCDVHVIVDPEVFLGDQASYLMDVLFSFSDPFGHTFDDDADSDDDSDDGYLQRVRAHQGSSRAKLLVLEDAGELVSSDARVAAGQALSRLLNMTDGILGQGANVSVLVTTNESIDRLHPAISRPGRCWSQLSFARLTHDQASEWLRAAHVDREAPSEGASLAQLYAWKRGDDVIQLDSLTSAR